MRVCLKHAILLIQVGSRGRLRAPGGVQGQRALEFSANKGIQDGRQE